MIAASFTKLFASITDSSIWSEDSDTKVVWVTMMAMADQFGRVSAAVPGLSKRAGVSIESTEKALAKFLAPDKHSRTKDHEGRRIEEIDGGWRLLNHEIYRNIRSDEDRKEQNRLAQQRRRDKIRQQNVSNSQQNQPRSAQAEAYTDTDTKKNTMSDVIKIPENLNTPDFLKTWEEWRAFRMKMKACKDWTTLWSKQLQQLEGYGVQSAIQSLNASMAGGWQGLFEPKTNVSSKSKPMFKRPSLAEIEAADEARLKEGGQ